VGGRGEEGGGCEGGRKGARGVERAGGREGLLVIDLKHALSAV